MTSERSAHPRPNPTSGGGSEQQAQDASHHEPPAEAPLVATKGPQDLFIDRQKKCPDPLGRSSLIAQLPSPFTEELVAKNGPDGA